MSGKDALYTSKTAALYASLGVTGTTYQPAFDALFTKIGSLRGCKVLDFGCGPGRSTKLLALLEPKQLIGVDHNAAMIEQARQGNTQKFELVAVPENSSSLPFPDQSFDAIFAFSVFCEFSDAVTMLKITQDLYRVLKPGGNFYMVTTNPDCLGFNFISFNYDAQPNVKDGDAITCHVHTETPFDIADTWWSLAALDRVFTTSGFRIENRSFPLAKEGSWLDESRVAAQVIYHLTR
jgi:SAM-dependent methyltransferase